MKKTFIITLCVMVWLFAGLFTITHADVLTGTPDDTDSLSYSYDINPAWTDTELYGFRLCYGKSGQWPSSTPCQDFPDITNPTGTFTVEFDWGSTYHFGGAFFLKSTGEVNKDPDTGSELWVTSIDTFVTPPQPNYPGAPASFRVQIKVTWNEKTGRYDVRVVQVME